MIIIIIIIIENIHFAHWYMYVKRENNYKAKHGAIHSTYVDELRRSNANANVNIQWNSDPDKENSHGFRSTKRLNQTYTICAMLIDTKTFFSMKSSVQIWTTFSVIKRRW